MTKGVIAARRQMFINEMVNVNTVAEMVIVYKKCYPRCMKDTTARANSYRLLHDAHIVRAIDALRRQREEEIKEARKKEIHQIARDQVASEIELDAILSNIALGKHRRRRNVLAYNKESKTFSKTTVEEEPDETNIVAAANLLYKRKGSFAPIGVKHEAGDTFIDFMMDIANLKNNNIPNAISSGSDKKV